MKNKKILLFSRDPGGANTIIPLFNPLIEKGYIVKLFGKDTALKKYQQSGLIGQNILDFVQDINLDSIRNFIKKLDPDVVITGTSADDFCEKYIWKIAEELNIPSFAILDQWMNYGIRFSSYSVSEFNQYLKSKDLKYLPTKILLMDEIAKKGAIQDGLPEDRLIVTGQPYFETIIKKRESLTQEKIKNLRRGLGLKEEDLLITFASEPITETYNSGIRKDDSFLGYTEITILDYLLEAISASINLVEHELYVLVKPHPKEKLEKFDRLKKEYKQSKINLIIDNSHNSVEIILASDVIFGMSSMFLIESVLLKKPTFSIQIGLIRENQFILDRINILKSILTYEELLNSFQNLISDNKNIISNCDFKVIENPAKNIINVIENYGKVSN